MMLSDSDSWAAHVHKLTELHRDIANGLIPTNEAKARLAQLKEEQSQFPKTSERQRINQAHDIVQKRITEQEEENMRQLRKRPRAVFHPQHVLDFKCQCKSCVRKHTITMEDRDFLHEMGISWGKVESDVTVPDSTS